MSKITITVAGATCSGKSFIKHQIAKHLQSIGLEVEVDEHELNTQAVMSRRDNPNKYVQAIKDRVEIEVTEKQLKHDLCSTSM